VQRSAVLCTLMPCTRWLPCLDVQQCQQQRRKVPRRFTPRRRLRKML